MDFRSLVVQLQYWNGRSRRLDGFSFFASTIFVQERSFSATDGFSLSGSTTVVQERSFTAT